MSQPPVLNYERRRDQSDDEGLNWARIAGFTLVVAIHAAAMLLLLAPVNPPSEAIEEEDTIRVVIIEPPPPSISYYNTYGCYPDISDWPDVKKRRRGSTILNNRNNKISIGRREMLTVSEISVDGNGIVDMGDWAGITIDKLTFGHDSTLLFYVPYGYNHIRLKKEFAEDDSILSRLGYWANSRDYILKRGCYENGYWALYPDYKIPFTPEPSTYGAVVSVCILGVGFWRKRKNRLKQSPKKPLGVVDTRAA